LARVDSNSLTVGDVVTGVERQFAAPGAHGFNSVVFAPDGTAVVTTGSDGVRLWDVATGNGDRLFPTHPEDAAAPRDAPFAVAFGPAGRRFAAVGRYLLTVWETVTGRIVHKVRIHPQLGAQVGGVAFSSDGRHIAIATKAQPKQTVPQPAEVKLWDAESGQPLSPLPGGGGGLAFSPDATRLASGNTDGTVTIWDAGSRGVVSTLRGHTGEVRDVAFTRDGRRLVTASADQTVRVWDPSTGREVLVLRGHGTTVVRVRLSPSGHHLASMSPGRPGQVRLWDARPIDP
jgi:WD40 repeat protein